MKIAYFDCFAGASGDMIMGALLDAGLPEETLRERLSALHLAEFELRIKRVDKKGFKATKVDVLVSHDVTERHLPEIETIIQDSDLQPTIRERAVAIFRRLGEVEADIHSTTLEQVHLHELGGVDTIVDVVGALVGLDALGIEVVYSSPLPMGRGFTQGAHGSIPLPAPATMALLKDVPIIGSDLMFELVTPTGAVLLTSLANSFGPLPAMTMTSVGYGAGEYDLPIPNVLRLIVGEQARPGTAVTETLVMLETNVDDLNPEIYDYVIGSLVDSGALDVSLLPVHMKKNRPATLIQVLCRPTDVEALTRILFAETSTLGLREHFVTRHALARTIQELETPYGAVRVKIAEWGEGETKAAPDYEDCRRLAELNHVPLREIYRAAEIAISNMKK